MNRATCLLACFLAGLLVPVRADEVLDLAGVWKVRLDAEDQGLSQDWPASPLDSDTRIALPGTTDLAGLGSQLDTRTFRYPTPFPPTTRFPGVQETDRADERGYLVRRHLHVGPAWYERTWIVPESWAGRPVRLRLERALWKTDVWIDGRHRGSCDSLVAEHRYELGPLVPGDHRLTVRVDNRMIHNLSTVTHAYGPETQSRWNGLIGDLRLEVCDTLTLDGLRVFPAPDRLSVRLEGQWNNRGPGPVPYRLRVRLAAAGSDPAIATLSTHGIVPAGIASASVTLRLAEPATAWSEFRPARYRLEATVDPDAARPSTTAVHFGFRHVERRGRELHLDGRPIFLRGTLDCAVYPRTGHPPMTVPEWERTFRIVRNHGFNHVRFHTWCPPEAAFEAADRLGLYLQAEAPAWVDDWGLATETRPPAIGRDPGITEFLRAELRRMSEAYGNHPSFLLCAVGNEFGMIGTDWDRVNGLVDEIKTYDPRRLYAGCGARKNLPADDFWFTHQTGAGTRGVGPAHTDWDFARAVETSPAPVIAHETGQRPVYPNFQELLPKFTGPLLPANLERHHRSLQASGMADRLPEFVRASAHFQFVQYKAEHEAMLRTRGYAGYQLLMLNDFTGQSEALVGILDPFWDGKGIVSPEDVRTWNAPTVPLARFARYAWTAGEAFSARIELAHFGNERLPAGPVAWTLTRQDGASLAGGRFDAHAVDPGGVATLGTLMTRFPEATNPCAARLSVRFASTENHWNLWVYPRATGEPAVSDVVITRVLDAPALDALDAGRSVLFLAHGLTNRFTARTGFESVYWSAGWWGNRFSSLGILCDPKHPALASFPTETHGDWQWKELCSGATTFDLTGAPPDLVPIVGPVPDFHFNTRLGQLFEVRVGNGTLLVCGYDLRTDLSRRLVARQLRSSLLRYLGSRHGPTMPVVATEWIESRLRSDAATAR